MVFTPSSYSKLESGFDYSLIPEFCSEDEISQHCNRYKSLYTLQHTKQWSNQKNSEWLARHYLAVKMILSASVMLTSLEYATRKNLRIVEPYLLYYSLLNSCRALLITLPELEWRNGELLALPHQSAINLTVDTFKNISKPLSQQLSGILGQAKVYRELFSYKFPARGLGGTADKITVAFGEVVKLCGLVSEVAQLNSECFQASFEKHVKGDYDIDEQMLEVCFKYDVGDGETIFDDEDLYRTGYFIRKQKRPYNLYWTAREGLVEDYFGAWCSEAEHPDAYNPDNNWRIIFPFM